MNKSNYLFYLSFMVALFAILVSCNNQKFEQGQKLYENHCESCHQKDGKGLAKLYPPLNNSDYWKENQNSVPCIIKNGLKDTIKVNGSIYTTHMAGLPHLTAYEISNIINYINYSWYDNVIKMDFKQIKEHLDNCK